MTRAEVAKQTAAKLTIEKLRLVVMFGFSPKDTDARKQERVSQLEETCRLLQLVGSERVISLPKRDQETLTTFGPRVYGFRLDTRPDTFALSDSRAYIERRYLTAGWIVGISDADLLRLRVIGCTDICPRITVKHPGGICESIQLYSFACCAKPSSILFGISGKKQPFKFGGGRSHREAIPRCKPCGETQQSYIHYGPHEGPRTIRTPRPTLESLRRHFSHSIRAKKRRSIWCCVHRPILDCV